MAEQICFKEFIASRHTSYDAFEDDIDVRAKALKNANEFFIKHDEIDVVTIVEDWSSNRSCLNLVVYYKSYI